MRTQISNTVFTGSSERLYLAPVCDTMCLHVQETAVETSQYHNEVSLAPFFHQAPVPHVLISHGDPSDHTLVKLWV